MIQFYVSHCCKHNLHVRPFETNDLILCIPWMYQCVEHCNPAIVYIHKNDISWKSKSKVKL